MAPTDYGPKSEDPTQELTPGSRERVMVYVLKQTRLWT
jgi:hypothetical protein